MIQLRTLGTIGLTADSSEDLAPVLRQPKRFALFLYLALARPRGFQRRDSLLALFWPELDTEHARASLRQALYTLRRQLPDGVLANRGDAEIALAPGVLWSDVQEFEDRIAAGDPAGALELYRGDLLPGFHVPDAAPELDYWIDGERARLQGMAASAASEASAAAEARGDLDAAVRWAARGSRLAPLDEEAARREIELRHRAGDRAGALLTYEQWAERLEAELGLEPDPATHELVERVRTEAPEPRRSRTQPVARPAARQADALVGAPQAPVSAPRPGRPKRRRLGHLGTGLLAGLVLAALIALLPVRLDWSDSAASPAGSRIMVLPFSYSGTGEASYLTEGLVYLFSVALDGDELRTVDPHGLIRRVGGEGRDLQDAASARELADEMGVPYFLLGSVVETRGGLQVTASVYERRQTAPVAQAAAAGAPREVLELVDAVAADLLTSLAGSPPSRLTRMAAVTTASLPALKAYLAGERLLRQGRYDGAIEAYESAIRADSTFALAHYRTSQAASWAFRGELATRAAAMAARHAERLPERERRLLRAHEAYRRGQGAAALEELRELSLLYPDDPEVWYRLGEVRMHFGPLEGWPLEEARAPFQRSMELEARYTDAVYHLAQLAALQGDTARVLEFAGLSLEAAPDGARAPQMRILQTLLGRGHWEDRLEELRAEDDFTAISSIYNAGVYARRPDRAREVAMLLTSPGRSEATRIFGYLVLAELDLAVGRRASAQEHLAGIRRIEPAYADEYAALLAAAPGSAASGADLRDLLERLSATADRRLAPAENPAITWKSEERYPPLPRLYALGLAAALAGDDEALETAVAGLAADSALVGYGTDLRLFAAEHGLHPAPAAPAGPPRFDRTLEETVLSPFLSRPARRFAEAQRLERAGALREALTWYESLAVYSIHDLPWGIPALLDRARIHERLGEEEAAAALYLRFAELWRDADDPVPARQALARLARLGVGDR